MNASEFQRRSRMPVAESHVSPAANLTVATLDKSYYDEELLFRFVVIESGDSRYLGIVENVSVEAELARPNAEGWVRETYPTVLKIRNLLHLRKDNSRPFAVRNAPRPQSKVYLASEQELARFFPANTSTNRVYLGRLRDTSYRLPLDGSTLTFSNTGLLAGIGHGKSHIAAQLVLQLHLSGRNVIIVDPTSEWPSLLEGQRSALETHFKSRVLLSNLDYEIDAEPSSSKITSFVDRALLEFKARRLTVLDLSLPRYRGLAEEKITRRDELVYALQQSLMTEAVEEYEKAKSPYAYGSCILLEEAHEFIPSSPNFEIQKKLNLLFSIATKEYRKYGLGLIFIDQSLGAVSPDLQVQTYLLGAPATPGDVDLIRSRLGRRLAAAVQRTRREGKASSWVAFGLATPFQGIPWEIVSFEDANDALEEDYEEGDAKLNL
jgi:DNA helicase HerA-like ATPase